MLRTQQLVKPEALEKYIRFHLAMPVPSRAKWKARVPSGNRLRSSYILGTWESTYAETLCTGDDLCLLELMDRTGPVLERLSCETASVIVRILTTHFLSQRFMDSVIHWFLQAMFQSLKSSKFSLFLCIKAENIQKF